jgi:hypothetical protein
LADYGFGGKAEVRRVGTAHREPPIARPIALYRSPVLFRLTTLG